MTLYQLIKTFEVAAQSQPSVNMIVQNDVFRINSAPSLRYGVFAWTQGQHSGNIATGFNSYNFTFFYVDRIKEDLSNQIEVQSVGCDTISNILRVLEEKDIEVSSFTMQPFNQRFTDSCAGVFCNVTLNVSSGHLCSEDFADYNADYNNDFLIY